MTDWLEELLEQVQGEDAAGEARGETLTIQDWLWARVDRASFGNGQPDGGAADPARTAGQAERPLRGRTGPEVIDTLPPPGEAEPTDRLEDGETEQAWESRKEALEGSWGWTPQTVWEEGLWTRSREEAGAEEVYRRLVRAGRGLSVPRPAERTAAAEQQSAGAPSLTVDQLDRAVRRDSRRYDGGMELY